MKNILLLLSAIVMYNFAMAQCDEIFISEYVEGSHNNKVLELYNPTNSAIVLDDTYRVVRFSNGATDSDTKMEYIVPLTGTINSYQAFVIAGDLQDPNAVGQDTSLFQEIINVTDLFVDASYNTGVQGSKCFKWNGDDAVVLQRSANGDWEDIDIIGEIGIRPADGAGWDDTPPYADGIGIWLTSNHTLVRKANIEQGNINDDIDPINSWYALAEYDSLPNNSFENLGIHDCNCNPNSAINSTHKNELLTFYPNPVTNQQFVVKSTKNIVSVEVLNIIGQNIFSKKVETITNETDIKLSNCDNGIYLVKVIFSDNKTAIKRILVK